MDSHPRVRCEGELLAGGHGLPTEYVTARSAVAGLQGMEAYGWKLLLSQFRNPGGAIHGIGDPSGYPARLHAMGYHLILLLRRNPVHQALSYIIGSNRQFHYRTGDGMTFAPIDVDPVDLMAATWIIEADTQLLQSFVRDVPHLVLTYEDALLPSAAHQVTVDRVCEYIGIDSAPMRTDLVKLTPTRLREAVSNFAAIAELFSKTRYARFLDVDDERSCECSCESTEQ